MPGPTTQNTLPIILFLGAIPGLDVPGCPLLECVAQLKEDYVGRAEVIHFDQPDEKLFPSDEDCKRIHFIFLATHVTAPEYDRFVEALPKRCPNLKHIHTRSTGINQLCQFDSILEAERLGLIVTNARGCFNDTLAEWCLYAMMHFAKHQYKLPAQKKAKVYQSFNIMGLKNKTVAILGYGDIGQVVGKIAHEGFGMKVIGLQRTAKPSAPYAEKVLATNTETLKEMFATADFIVSVLPKTPATDGLISDEVLAASHKDLIFVNIGRGTNVDQDALIKHLNAGTIRGAALDVQREEPVHQDDELWNVGDDKLLLSPHTCDHSDDIDQRSLNRMLFILTSVMEDKFDMANRTSCAMGY